MNRKTVLVGVCGGVAAYKALDVISGLRKDGHEVRVVVTEAAKRFVGKEALAAVSGAAVLDTLWPEGGKEMEELFPHLYPSTRADLFVLLAATANTIAKIAHGFGSDVLSTCVLSLPQKCVRVFAPAMNVEMWANARVRANVEALEREGWIRLGPASGVLACGTVGEGRMMEPMEILGELRTRLDGERPLAGKTLLILSGPTHEHLDPIRYIGNPSSGLMGRALAEVALSLGARVVFVSGPVPEANLPRGAEIHRVTSALEMLAAARVALPEANAVVFAAAVADYRPAQVSGTKLPKREDSFDLRLVPNPDLAATLRAEMRPGVCSIGFALQTHDGQEQARGKLRRKGFDGIVLNGPDSLGAVGGTFSWLGRNQAAFENWGPLSKHETAQKILRKVIEIHG